MAAMQDANHWFTALTADELSAVVALYQKPLYQYADPDSGDLHILFVGTSERMKTFLRLSLVIGQMLNRTLHIHVLASDALACRDELKASAPCLCQYSNLGGGEGCAQPLALFDFVDHKSPNSASAGKRIRESCLGHCRYIVVDLPKGDALLKSLASSCSDVTHPCLVLYTGSTAVKPGPGFQLYSLDLMNRARRDALVQLSHQAFRLHCYYDRQYGYFPNKSREDTLQEFLHGESRGKRLDPHDIQYSNLTAVLHVKYKLASIGIPPRSGRRRIMAQCGRLLYGSSRELYEDLTVLEHRRWVMEKLLGGFHAPTMDEMYLHCYCGTTNKWWSPGLHFHNCLVDSRPRRASSLRGLTVAQWDELSGIGLPMDEAGEKIAASPYDPLDQASLTVHYLAWKKMLDLSRQLRNADIVQLSEHIDCALHSGRTAPDHLERPDRAIRDWMASLSGSMDASRQALILRELDAYAEALMLEKEGIEQLKGKLNRLATLAREYYGLKDYKTMDEDVIDLLAYLYMSDQAVVMKIGAGSSILDSIASSLLIEPARLVLTDALPEDAERIREFFAHRGGYLQTEYRPIPCEDAGARMAQLKRMIGSISKKLDAPLILDLTGASGSEILGITDYVRKSVPNAAVITCDCKTQAITSIHNFPESACIRMKQRLRTEEIFRLIGTRRQQRIDEGDALRLRDENDRFWHFYSCHADRISEINVLLRAMINCTRATGSKPLDIRLPDAPEYAGFQIFGKSAALFDSLRLGETLRELQALRAVRDLSITRNHDGTVDYQGSALASMLKEPAFRSYLELNTKHALKPVSADGIALHYAEPGVRDLYVNVEFQSGGYQRLTLLRNREASGALPDRLQAFLNELKKAEDDPVIDFSTESDKPVRDEFNNPTNMIERVHSFITADPRMMYLRYRGKKPRVFAFPARDIIPILNDMKNAHLIEELRISDCPDDQSRRVSFLFTSSAALNHLSTPGSFLESRIYADATNLHLFDHVDTNYKFAWNSEKQAPVNEFDVLCVSGLRLLLISSKATNGTKEHLYEVSAMAKRLSRTAQPIVVYSDKSRVTDPVIRRARSMGVLLAFAQGGSEEETISAVLRRAMER